MEAKIEQYIFLYHNATKQVINQKEKVEEFNMWRVNSILKNYWSMKALKAKYKY